MWSISARCQPASPVQLFFSVDPIIVVVGLFFSLLVKWSVAGCGCSMPSGNWSVASCIKLSLHLFLNSDQLVAETFLDVSCFHGENRFKSIFFAAEDLHFFLVVVELIGDALDLILDEGGNTSRVWSLPLREAGLDPKLFPVSFMELYIILINKCHSNWELKRLVWVSSDLSSTPSKEYDRTYLLTQCSQRRCPQTQYHRLQIQDLPRWQNHHLHQYSSFHSAVNTLEDAFPCRGDKKW